MVVINALGDVEISDHAVQQAEQHCLAQQAEKHCQAPADPNAEEQHGRQKVKSKGDQDRSHDFSAATQSAVAFLGEHSWVGIAG